MSISMKDLEPLVKAMNQCSKMRQIASIDFNGGCKKSMENYQTDILQIYYRYIASYLSHFAALIHGETFKMLYNVSQDALN